MLTANEARALMPEPQHNLPAILEHIGDTIELAADKGETSCQVNTRDLVLNFILTDDLVDSIKSALVANGFTVVKRGTSGDPNNYNNYQFIAVWSQPQDTK